MKIGACTSSSINSTAIDAAIASLGRRCRFEPALEARFERDTAADRCRRVVRHNYVGLVVYNLFIGGDWLLVRDVFPISVVLHILVMTPIMFAVNGIVRRNPPVWLREGILGGGILLGVMAIAGLMWISHSPLRTHEHHAIVLVILFATMIQRIRFRYVLPTCIVALAIYVAALAPFAAEAMPSIVVADAVLAGVILFSLIGCYNLECEQRMSYLLGLRDRLLHEELEELSRRDPLTGTRNRRALQTLCTQMHEAASPIALLLCDIDHFKAYNDARGHLDGDVCIKRVAHLIGETVNGSLDNIYRFGGEEFLVIVEGVAAERAMALGERIRSRVEAEGIKHRPGTSTVVTVSIGIALGNIADGSLLFSLIGEADAALYAAKAVGRNTVVLGKGPAEAETDVRLPAAA